MEAAIVGGGTDFRACFFCEPRIVHIRAHVRVAVVRIGRSRLSGRREDGRRHGWGGTPDFRKMSVDPGIWRHGWESLMILVGVADFGTFTGVFPSREHQKEQAASNGGLLPGRRGYRRGLRITAVGAKPRTGPYYMADRGSEFTLITYKSYKDVFEACRCSDHS